MAGSSSPCGAWWMDSFPLSEPGWPRTHFTRGSVSDGRLEQVKPPWTGAPVSGPEQFGNSQEVVGQHGRPHQNLETLAALGPAALHPAAAKQHRDAPLDAHPKTLPLFERPAALESFLLRRPLSAALGNAHLLDSSLLAAVHIVGTVKAPTGGVQIGSMLEDLLMTIQRSLHLGGVGGIAVQNLIVGDQALGTLGQEDLVTELHRLALLAPLDQVRVGLEDG